MKRFLFVILLLAIGLGAKAQKPVVSGTVVNSQTGRPIAGANVSALGGNEAVVTNGDGFFTLKMERMPRGVRVSHLGFEQLTVGNSQFAAGDNPSAAHAGETGGANYRLPTIRLRPAAIMLNEVVVTNENARNLVEAAMSKIAANYSNAPELLEGFYRETGMKRQHFIYVAEGVVDIYKTAYNRSAWQDRVAIRKGRRLLSPRQGDTLGLKVMGGPVQAVQLDIAKNRDFLLNKNELNYYAFSMDTPQRIDGRLQHVVRLEPRVVMPFALYHGLLYIDRETLAFTRVEMSLDMSDREKATRCMLIRKPAGVRFRPKEMSLLIDYKQGEDGVTRMSYIRNVFRFNCDWRRRLLATSFTATCEMVVTNRSNDVHPIKGRQTFDSRDLFFDRVDYFRDAHFWEDYNIIEPTESLDKAVNRLLKKY